eukprot:284819655_3
MSRLSTVCRDRRRKRQEWERGMPCRSACRSSQELCQLLLHRWRRSWSYVDYRWPGICRFIWASSCNCEQSTGRSNCWFICITSSRRRGFPSGARVPLYIIRRSSINMSLLKCLTCAKLGSVVAPQWTSARQCNLPSNAPGNFVSAPLACPAGFLKGGFTWTSPQASSIRHLRLKRSVCLIMWQLLRLYV